ncbi:redoxin domain-containing protein [Psychroserpens sp.]|uniref:redoxin domain-containing protein n=2 Tax=Psychroserpens sp. TaxID=2020870 RepID=UPI002AA7EF84|nr:redoxin domain-containing protein [Psychroserpens sp.]
MNALQLHMKNYIALLLTLVLLASCKTEEPKPEGYVISGTAPGLYNGIRVFLQAPGERGRKVNMDTAIVMNEAFKFEGKVDNPKLWSISANSVNGSMPLIVENDVITIAFDKDRIDNTVITGTRSNELLANYYADLRELANKRAKSIGQFRTSDDPAVKKQAEQNVVNINLEQSKLPFKYMSEYKEDIFPLVLINDMLNNKDADLNKLAAALDGLDSDVKSEGFGQMVSNKLETIRKQRAALSATEIGNKAPEFTAPTPDGKQLALNDVLGKVTIVDFWAAWCGPCRRENPNVVKVYEKYHEKGLEIIGVSLDGTTRQKDPKASWLKAIEQDNLTWHQVSNLSYFNDPVARKYNISSIPATFILDENGVIVAKNLRGPQLEAKIAEMLE